MWTRFQLEFTPDGTSETSHCTQWLCLQWFWESLCLGGHSFQIIREFILTKKPENVTHRCFCFGFHSAFTSTNNFLPERNLNTICWENWFLYLLEGGQHSLLPAGTTSDHFRSFPVKSQLPSPHFFNLTVSPRGQPKWDATSFGSLISHLWAFLMYWSFIKLEPGNSRKKHSWKD